MKTNNLFSTGLRAAMTLLVALVIFTACQPESESPLDEQEEQISDIVAELSAEEMNALGVTPDEAKAAIITQSQINDLTGNDKSFSNGRWGLSITSAYVTDLLGDTVGVSKMIRTSNGVIPVFITSGLVVNSATTLWVLGWNSPENCAGPECTMFDIFNPAVGGDVLGAGGKVVRSSRLDVRLTYIAKGDTSGSVNPFLLGMPPVGITDPMNANFVLAIRSHGPVIPELLSEQLNTYNGGCTFDFLPPIPQLGAAGPNTCEDIQFSRHTVD
ncbi:MAG: hypothetical protein WBA74_06975 [Cyclobacteriaceae bacterium]